jgi:hypothetical protein
VKRVRTLGILLAAVFALGAPTAAGASAKLPEFGGCEAAPNHEGKYADAGCTEPLKKVYDKYTGGYEWNTGEQFHRGEGLVPYTFEGGEIGPTTFETTSGKKIECTGGELGETAILGPKAVGEVLTFFTGCEAEGQECAGKFLEAGTISDQPVWRVGEGFKGELVYVAGKGTSTPTVGLTLTAFRKAGEVYEDSHKEIVTATGNLFTVVCEGPLGTVEIGGAGGKKGEKSKGNTVISLISPIDEMTKEYTQTFAETGGVQEPGAAEKGKPLTLQMFLGNENKWVQMGLASTFQDISERGQLPTEIKAVE